MLTEVIHSGNKHLGKLGCGTWCHGLVEMLGHGLDSMIFNVSSNQVILCDSVTSSHGMGCLSGSSIQPKIHVLDPNIRVSAAIELWL